MCFFLLTVFNLCKLKIYDAVPSSSFSFVFQQGNSSYFLLTENNDERLFYCTREYKILFSVFVMYIYVRNLIVEILLDMTCHVNEILNTGLFFSHFTAQTVCEVGRD